jgi:hypothetical protein
VDGEFGEGIEGRHIPRWICIWEGDWKLSGRKKGEEHVEICGCVEEVDV